MANHDIDTIHLVFKTHLDVGFTDFAETVKQDYFSSYIPKAVEMAKSLRRAGGNERFIWTTGSWIIYEFLEEASPENRKWMEEAIDAGDVVWHGLPFTTYTEMMDASLFRFGLSLSQELDRRFGKKTIAAKMSDVPGHTRAIVPMLAEAGIRVLHIGVNPSSTPPDVPPAFVWRSPDGSEVTVIYQKGEYGGLTVLPGMRTAMSIAQTLDNVGPQSGDDVIDVFTDLRNRYVGAEVVASTLEGFAEDILQNGLDLPVVTDEIGDSWIHGIGTDPTKVRRFRELCRLRNELLADGKAAAMPGPFTSFSRSLVIIPEHTWGLDQKAHAPDYENYTADAFARVRKTENYRKLEAAWQEQRGYLEDAIAALSETALNGSVQERLDGTEPRVPDLDGFEEVGADGQLFETPHFKVGFDPDHGAINRLVDREAGYNWAGARNPLGQFTYEVFSQQDYDRFLDQYQYPDERYDWFVKDCSKPGLDSAVPAHKTWHAALKTMWRRDDNAGVRFILEMSVEREASATYGCPARLFMEVDFPRSEKAVLVNFQWFEKRASRPTEALWLSFSPRTAVANGWTMDKMGEAISPLEVIRNGNRKLHAVQTGVEYQDDRRRFSIESHDAPLVAPGEMSLLDFNNRQPPLKRGMHFNLFNSVFGTNFPNWFEEDGRFRFVLRF